MFAIPSGGPLDHNTDYHEWKRLLKAAGLSGSQAARRPPYSSDRAAHPAPAERTVMSLRGWSSTDMAKRYQHVTDAVRADVASQVGSLIWEARTEGAADETVTVRRHSLATILQLVEDGLLKHEDVDDLDLAELKDTLADLHAAMATPDNDANGEAK